MFTILLIAISLALDAFAVSVSCGLTGRGGIRLALRLGIWFGAFQFLMPLLGFTLGRSVAGYVAAVSPWVAFGLLSFIGGRMLLDAGSETPAPSELSASRLLALAVATSIDALAVGVSFAFLRVNILAASAVIGLVAFLLSLLGGTVGGTLSGRFQARAESLGGAALIAIGAKILIENVF